MATKHAFKPHKKWGEMQDTEWSESDLLVLDLGAIDSKHEAEYDLKTVDVFATIKPFLRVEGEGFFWPYAGLTGWSEWSVHAKNLWGHEAGCDGYEDIVTSPKSSAFGNLVDARWSRCRKRLGKMKGITYQDKPVSDTDGAVAVATCRNKGKDTASAQIAAIANKEGVSEIRACGLLLTELPAQSAAWDEVYAEQKRIVKRLIKNDPTIAERRKTMQKAVGKVNPEKLTALEIWFSTSDPYGDLPVTADAEQADAEQADAK